MESGERLASPAPTLSAARTSSPAASSSSSSSSSSSPAPHPKSSLAPSPSTLGSTLSTSGEKHLFFLCRSSVCQKSCSQRKKIQAHPHFPQHKTQIWSLSCLDSIQRASHFFTMKNEFPPVLIIQLFSCLCEYTSSSNYKDFFFSLTAWVAIEKLLH